MIKKVEEFLFGKIAGRVIARLAVSAAAFLVGQGLSIGVTLNPDEVSAAMIAGANALYSMLKDWRDKRAAASAPKP